MTGALQTDALIWFRGDGRKALVATRAAEEGLDVASCELVVRYSVTLTGIPKTNHIQSIDTTLCL